jgi:periplasmic protein CpxP/Spy
MNFNSPSHHLFSRQIVLTSRENESHQEKKTMRKQITLLTLSTFLGLGAAVAAPYMQQDQQPAPQEQAQPNARPVRQVDPAKQLKHLSKKLSLTSDQQNQILPILADRQQQMTSLRSDSSLSRQDRVAKVRALREDSESKIRAVLTDSQKQQYDQMQQQMRERRRHGQGQGVNG